MQRINRHSLLALMGAVMLPFVAAAADMPCWRGVQGNGVSPDCAEELVDDAKRAKVRWFNTDVMAGWKHQYIGFSNPVVGDGKLYYHYHQGDPEVVDLHYWQERYFGKHARDPEARRWYARQTAVSASDVVVCIDIVTGMTLWQRRFPGVINWQNSHKIGIKTDGVYVAGRYVCTGVDGRVYCLDGASGMLLWQGDLGVGHDDYEQYGRDLRRIGVRHMGGRRRANCSALTFAQGVVVVPCGSNGPSILQGYDLASGRLLWSVSGGDAQSSPARWVSDGTSYLVFQGSVRDFRTGKVLSRFKAGGPTPTIAEDLVINDRFRDGIDAWKLSVTGACSKAWPFNIRNWGRANDLRCATKGASTAAAIGRYLFFTGQGSTSLRGDAFTQRHPGATKPGYSKDLVLFCLDTETGKVLNHRLVGGQSHDKNNTSSLVIADGRLFRCCGIGIEMCKAGPGLEPMGVIEFDGAGGWYSVSPTVVDGYLFYPTNRGYVCVDLRKKPLPVPAPQADPVAASDDPVALARFITNPNRLLARRAAGKLVAMGDAARPAVKELGDLKADSPEGRRTGTMRLALRVMDAAGAVEAAARWEQDLAQVACGRDAAAALAAIRELRFAPLRDVAAGRALLKLAGDPEAQQIVRVEAVRALGAMGPAAAPLADGLVTLALLGQPEVTTAKALAGAVHDGEMAIWAVAVEAVDALKQQHPATPLKPAAAVRLAQRLRNLRQWPDPRPGKDQLNDTDFLRIRLKVQLAMLLYEQPVKPPALLQAILAAHHSVWPQGDKGFVAKYLACALSSAGKAAVPAIEGFKTKDERLQTRMEEMARKIAEGKPVGSDGYRHTYNIPAEWAAGRYRGGPVPDSAVSEDDVWSKLKLKGQ